MSLNTIKKLVIEKEKILDYRVWQCKDFMELMINQDSQDESGKMSRNTEYDSNSLLVWNGEKAPFIQ